MRARHRVRERRFHGRQTAYRRFHGNFCRMTDGNSAAESAHPKGLGLSSNSPRWPSLSRLLSVCVERSRRKSAVCPDRPSPPGKAPIRNAATALTDANWGCSNPTQWACSRCAPLCPSVSTGDRRWFCSLNSGSSATATVLQTSAYAGLLRNNVLPDAVTFGLAHGQRRSGAVLGEIYREPW